MHIAKEQIPVKIAIPNATARHQPDFGQNLAAEYFSLGAGTDIAPLLQGLEDDSCQSPHWGYILGGEIVVTYTNGGSETCATNDLFFWPPGHSVRVTRDAEVVLFSPTREHGAVMDHMLKLMAG